MVITSQIHIIRRLYVNIWNRNRQLIFIKAVFVYIIKEILFYFCVMCHWFGLEIMKLHSIKSLWYLIGLGLCSIFSFTHTITHHTHDSGRQSLMKLFSSLDDSSPAERPPPLGESIIRYYKFTRNYAHPIFQWIESLEFKI